MKRILSPVQIQNACIKVSCGSDQGTAFYISDKLLLTAYHIVLDATDGTEILIHTDGGPQTCTIKSYDLQNDICILSCPNKGKSVLPLLSAASKVGEKCGIYGFPFQRQAHYLALEGKVVQVIINDKSDFVVGNLNIDRNFDYEGLSGSPVIINGSVIGLVLRQLDDRISAISIKRLNDFLQGSDFSIEEEYLYHNVPGQFLDEVKTATPNYAVLENIEEVLKGSGNWLLLQGSPGSGKSTLAASFIPDDENLVICGRYFIKVPNDTEPISLRTAPAFFLETLENLIGIILTGFPLAKEDLTFENRIKRVPQLFEDLSEYFEQKGQIGIIIIDGLDEVRKLDEFLGILSSQLPQHLKIVLSCTSKDILPVPIRNEFDADNIVLVTPIDLGQCEFFITSQIGDKKLPVELIQQVAAKSEGHPLYLRYLINYIKTSDVDKDETELEEWVKTIPTIGGDISKYYNVIWDTLSKVPDRLWIVIILSQLRQVVTKEELFNILPQQYQMSFNSYFSGIGYLLNESDNRIEIYHNSFKDFIVSKTNENRSQANDFISAYCEKHAKDRFSINNTLYHYALGSSPQKAIDGCNQKWADDCANAGVSPDIVINDIKRIIDLSLDQQCTTDLIRLLLLLQRIEFRYDSVFAENARLIALALTATGKYDQAIKYLVRENTLLVNNDDAILFLQLFYEHKADKEAKNLLNAIEARYRRLLQEGLDSKKGVSTDTFILKLNSLSLSMNEDYETGLKKVMGMLQSLKEFQEAARKDGDEVGYQTMYRTREHGASFFYAYIIRMFGSIPDSETVSKKLKMKLDNKWAGMRALSAVLYHSFNAYNIPVLPKDENYFSLITDIEYLARTYGYEDDERTLRLLISALLEDCKDSKLISELITKYLSFTKDFQFRKPNGVDLNYQEIHRLYLEFVCNGYIDDTGKYPAITAKLPRYKYWQEYVVSLVQFIAFTEGRLFRLRADEKSTEKEVEKLGEIFKSIDFTFDERSYWENSYQLPESIFPIIYLKLLRLYVLFHNDAVETVLAAIGRKSNDQIGLYSEGYRECLSEIVKELIKGTIKRDLIMPVINLWRDHTIVGLQNRWERTPELLKITEVYGLINEKDLAENTFGEMLKTSMGPGWYKEAQFDLLNSVLSLKTSEGKESVYLKKFAGILDFASGEMTFQRYVRNEKESFVGSLSKQVNLGLGIEYLKFEVLPPAEALMFNAETFTIDAPRKGDGYALGARNITEESAVLRVLETEMNPYLAWALCHIFSINDDIFRYIHEFGSSTAAALNAIEAREDGFLQEIHKHVAETASQEKMKEERGQFLTAITKELTDSNRQHFKGHLLAKGIAWDIEDRKDESSENDEAKKETTAFSDFNKKYKADGSKDREALLADGFEAFEKERISIWFGNWSTESDRTKVNVRSLLSSDKEALPFFRESIRKYDNAAWVMANRIIWFFENLLSPAQISEVYGIIAEHFSLLVHPEQRYLNKYLWIEESRPDLTNDEVVVNFIIWLLNHPVNRISGKAFDTLLSLCMYTPDLVIFSLVKEAILEKPAISTEKCSLILKEISEKNAEKIIKMMKAESWLVSEIVSIQHFSIKKNFLELSIDLNKNGYVELYEAISTTYPQSIILTGEVVLNEDYLEPIDYEINELNELQILNREFAETLLKKIKEYCSPLSIDDFKRSDRYLQRSFFEDKDHDARFRYIVKYALNVSVTRRVDQSNIQAVYDLLN